MNAPVVAVRADADGNPPFMRGSGQWQGVVAITRTKNLDVRNRQHTVLVESARSIRFEGRRAIVCALPYGYAVRYFQAEDQDVVYHYAEMKDGHLEIYERASHKDFFMHHGGT